MIVDEPGFKDNCNALLMIGRGYHLLLAVKNVVSLEFDALGTHSESNSDWLFNTKEVENKSKWPQKDFNSHGARTQCTAIINSCVTRC